MKGIRAVLRVALLVALAVVLAGCRQRAGDTHAHDPGDGHHEEETTAPQFSAKKGISMTDETRQSIGLKTVEVTERKVISAMEFQLRVYRKAGKTALASGMVTPVEAQLLRVGENVDVGPGGGKTVRGVLTKVDDQVLSATGYLEVLVEVADAPEEVSEGTFIQAHKPTQTGGTVTSIPRAALLECSEGRFVYAVSGEHLVRTAVMVGASDGELVQITDGLYPGDQVAMPVMSLWMTELAAVKGGQACCVAPPKGK